MSPLFKMEKDKIFGTHGYINDIPRIQPRLGLINFIKKQLESIMKPWKSVTLKTVTQQILHVILIIIWIEIYKIFYQWALKIIDFQFLGRAFCQLELGQVRICPRTPLARKQTAGGNRKLHTNSGGINWSAVAYYNHLIDMLVLHDITLFVTLFHYDLPQDLQNQYDGWLGMEFCICSLRNIPHQFFVRLFFAIFNRKFQ